MILKHALFALLLAASPVALAHPESVAGGAFHGLAHPFAGIDHLLAMLTVGVWAARFCGAARWLLPAAFVGCMLIGALLGYAGMPLPGTEPMIAASVLVFGAAVAIAVRMHFALCIFLVGVFALFHGHAHLAEMPEGMPLAAFSAGMLAGTAALHAAGVLLGVQLGRAIPWLPRALGGAVSLAGAWLLIA